jgi:hypothetical protein
MCRESKYRPDILDLGMRWRWVISCTKGKEPLVAIGWENELVQEPVLDALEKRAR